ncbi:MAG: HAD-IIA family hydrolase [Rubrobacteraceae bacterium]|nr:HAD-IIA family hydrolase [Rubrobacteraceae bacterium]
MVARDLGVVPAEESRGGRVVGRREARSSGTPGVPERLYEGYVFDLDGTIYLGDELLPGAKRLILKLRELGKRVVFLSNNATKDPRMYAEKLDGLGLKTPASEIVNTVVTMTEWLLSNHPDATVFPISEEPLKNSLSEAGIRISEDPEEIDIVIASYDRTFEYRKLQIAFDAIWFYKRAMLVTTNPDRYCPFPGGRGEPDAAAIVAAIEACTGTKCQVNVGKPDPIMLETVMGLIGLDAKECVMIGDRLYTEIRMAKGAGIPSAVVLTGETTEDDLAGEPEENLPDYTLERIDQLVPRGLWDEFGWKEGAQ